MEWLAALFLLSGLGALVSLLVRLGDAPRHSLLLFSTCALALFHGLGPLGNWLLEPHVLHGLPLDGYYAQEFFLYGLGLWALAGGYYWGWSHYRPWKNPLPGYFRPAWLAKNVITGILLGLLAVLLLNMVLNHYEFWSVFDFTDQRERLQVFKRPFHSIVLESFTNAFMSALVLAWIFRMKRWVWLLWAVPLLVFFALTGWRYRVVLTLAVLVWDAWLFWPQTRARRWAAAALVLLATVGVPWLTVNRWYLGKRQFDQMQWSLSGFNYHTLLTELNTSQTFLALLKYKDEQDLGPDWGQSMLGHIVVRAMPSSWFPNAQKPLAPNLQLIQEAVPRPNPRGFPAVGLIEEWYLSFGYSGVLLGMAALGWLMTRLPDPRRSPWNRAVIACLGIVAYQWISRGYLPQQVELAVVLSLPFWILYRLSDAHARAIQT